MSALRERMTAALTAKQGATKAGMARACNISKASVSDWFSGKTTSLDATNLIKAAAYLGVRPEWLATGRGRMRDEENQLIFDSGQENAGGDGSVQLPVEQGSSNSGRDTEVRGPVLGVLEPWDDDTPLEEDEVEVPLYKETEFAVGGGIMAPHIELTDYKVRFARSTLRKAGVDPANAACATASGNSMADYIVDGATIGIDRGRTQVKDGKIFAIDHGGLLRVKYLYKLPGGGLRLRSHNSDEYPDETFGADWPQKIKVLGWVFWRSSIDTW